jgi:hypothetical protein
MIAIKDTVSSFFIWVGCSYRADFSFNLSD